MKEKHILYLSFNKLMAQAKGVEEMDSHKFFKYANEGDDIHKTLFLLV